MARHTPSPEPQLSLSQSAPTGSPKHALPKAAPTGSPEHARPHRSRKESEVITEHDPMEPSWFPNFFPKHSLNIPKMDYQNSGMFSDLPKHPKIFSKLVP
jgi:hypothetical protein